MKSDDQWRSRLREIIEKKGVSAREVSIAIGNAESYIHGLITTNRTPSISSFYQICDYLDVTPNWLYFGITSEDDTEIEELRRIYRQIPEPKRKAFLDAVTGIALFAKSNDCSD